MNNFGPSIGALKPPKLQVIPKLAAAPKTIKMPAPKIAAIHVSKSANGGMIVQHHMTHGPKPIPFVFSNPARGLAHLKRVQANEWRMPDRDPATNIDKSLNLDS